jgi:uncharacterized Zn-finger protein
MKGIRGRVAMPRLPGVVAFGISEEDRTFEDVPMPIAPPETEIVTAWRVSCDGGEGALGHPRVWLSVDRDTGFVECGYCDKKFVHADFAEGLGLGSGDGA